jgi:hypothetical protein
MRLAIGCGTLACVEGAWLVFLVYIGIHDWRLLALAFLAAMLFVKLEQDTPIG